VEKKTRRGNKRERSHYSSGRRGGGKSMSNGIWFGRDYRKKKAYPLQYLVNARRKGGKGGMLRAGALLIIEYGVHGGEGVEGELSSGGRVSRGRGRGEKRTGENSFHEFLGADLEEKCLQRKKNLQDWDSSG